MAAPTLIGFAPYQSYPSTASTSWFSPVGMAAGQVSSASGTSPESNFRSRIAVAGTIANATASIISNTRNTVSSLTLWKGGAPTTLSITIGAGVTGLVSDTTHSVSVAVDDEVSAEYANGLLGGAVRLASYMAQFTPSSGGAVQKLGNGDTNTSTSTSAFTVFLTLAGDENNNTVENNSSIRSNVAGTYSDYTINVITNSRTTNGSLRFRKGGANGNGNVTITSATTGIFKDTSNTDTVVESDVIALFLTGGSGATSFVYNAAGAWLTPTTDGEQLVARSQTGTFSSAVYLPAFGSGVGNAVEANAQGCLGLAGTLSLMSVRVTTNSSSADVTFRLRIDGADGNQGFIISAGATGLFTDTSNSDTLTATNLITQSVSGQNGNMICRSAGFKFNSASGTTTPVSAQASSSAVASLARQTGKPLAASSSAVASAVRAMAKSLAASSAAVASLSNQTGKAFQAASSAVANLNKETGKPCQSETSSAASLSRSTGKPLQAESASVADLATQKVILVAIQAASSAVASCVRECGKLANAASNCVASAQLQTAKAFQASSAAVASLAKETAKSFQTASNAVASESHIRVTILAFQASSQAVASLVRSVGKPLQAASGAAASLSRVCGKAVQASTASVASLRRDISKSFQASTSPVAGLVRGFALAFQAESHAIATMTKAAGVTIIQKARMAASKLSITLLGNKGEINLEATRSSTNLDGEIDQ